MQHRHTTQINLNKEVRHDILPLGIKMTEVMINSFTKIGANHMHTIDLPFGLLPIHEITMNIIEEKTFMPLLREKDNQKAKKIYSKK